MTQDWRSSSVRIVLMCLGLTVGYLAAPREAFGQG